MRIFKNILLVTITGVLIYIMFCLSPIATDMQTFSISAVPVSMQDISKSITAKGVIQSQNRQSIYVKSACRVLESKVKAGDRVQAGQLLFTVVYTPREQLPDLEQYLAQYGIPAEVFNQEQVQAVKNAIFSENITEQDDQPQAFYAAIDGIVTELNIQSDGLATPLLPIAVISDPGAMEVQIQVPESFVYSVRTGQQVNVTGEAFPGKIYTAKIHQISPVAKQTMAVTGQSNTVVEVFARIVNPDAMLKPGYSANTKIFVQRKENACILPYEAIWQDKENREIVFVVSSGRAYKRLIKTGFELENSVEVLGVSEGEIVIINPSDRIKNGVRVTLNKMQSSG